MNKSNNYESFIDNILADWYLFGDGVLIFPAKKSKENLPLACSPLEAKMSYSQFTNLEMIETNFGITIADRVGIFANIPESEYSDLLSQTLQENISLALAINTEKARSELIVTPLLVELRKQFQYQISFFSGKEFNVDLEKGLNGFCDFLISRSPEQLLIKAPVVALVEAKNDNIQAGLPQCMAEMIAAQLFNERRNNNITEIYGVVTTGTNWKFLRLTNQIMEVDLNDYFIDNISKIVGILKYLMNPVNLNSK